MDKWNEFLDELDDLNDFDKGLKAYLPAIKYVSEITIQNIDDIEVRKEINKKLKTIVDFIEKYKDYYEIGLVKGFKSNTEENGRWKIDGRDYYYYIADQKMKAAVYYVRYRNFIDKCLGEYHNAESTLANIISEIKKSLGDIEVSEDNIISVIDNDLEPSEENYQLRCQCLDCILKKKSKDITYLKYMLFNNMMQEIRYIGAAYQYLWYWETKEKDLFRCASYEGNQNVRAAGNSKKLFLQEMFGNVISHMNNTSKTLCSYSEDPYIDIFKYLNVCFQDNGFVEIYHDSNIEISIENLDNSSRAQFDIIRGVQINSVYRNGNPMSFYEFIQDGKEIEDSETISYAVELYPELPNREKNSKNTSKNIKELLCIYLKTWKEDGDIERLMSYVADDKEVVTNGKIENRIIDVNNNEAEELCNGCRYSMSLSKDELISLLLRVKDNIDLEDFVKKFKVSLTLSNIDGWIKQVIQKSGNQSCPIDGKILMNITDKKTISINFKILIADTFFSDEDKTIDGCKKKINNKVDKEIHSYFYGRYQKILQVKYKQVEFILNYIEKAGYKCPSYISEYNEFFPKGKMIDKEISLLKYLIFKRR